MKPFAKLLSGILNSLCLLVICGPSWSQALVYQGWQWEIQRVAGQAPTDAAELRGVSAGVFHEPDWAEGNLHFVSDLRYPLLAPSLSGGFRNIYAPSAVETLQGWKLFYGGWDGSPTPNDRIYTVDTGDFLSFEGRRNVIDHGPFVHVCNVNALSEDGVGVEMVCTSYPDEKGTNKPVIFSSTDGIVWKGSSRPAIAGPEDRVMIQGYPGFDEADMNGMNVLLKENGEYRLYFGDFKNFGKVYRASGSDPKNLQYEGPVLDAPHMVNDVRKFEIDGKAIYLMALHANKDTLWYSLSSDGLDFQEEKVLGKNQGEEDQHIVAAGWVTRGRRVLGYLYGAGAVPELNRNRIFARWLQKKVVFVAEDGKRYEATGAVGPDRQQFAVPKGAELSGHFEVYAEDGKTRLGDPQPGKLAAGSIYQLNLTPPEEAFVSLLDEDLSQWKEKQGWAMKDGLLEFSGEGTFLIHQGNDFGDFVLRFEYRLPVGGNSGVFIRQPRSGFSAFEGFEIQVLDDKAEVYKGIKPYQHAGSIYSVVAAAKDVIKPAGEWNSMEILCSGSRIRVQINEETVADALVDDYDRLKQRPRSGPLGLQNHGSALEFRNLRLSRLD